MSKIFGIGLNKTGTSSLHEALEILGFSSIHYPQDETTYEELSYGNFKLSVMNKCDAANDISIAPYYAELDDAFPGSQFILTVRDKQEWLKSIKRHWASNRFIYDETLQRGHKQKMARFVTLATFGCYQLNSERFLRVYDRHCKNVKEYFGNKVLIYNICGGGWLGTFM